VWVCGCVRERLVHSGGECVGVCREGPLSLLCYFSWGTFYKKIIYCTSFVYLEKRLKLFVALSSSGWVSVGCHCHLQVPRKIEATWNAMWLLPSLAPFPTHLAQEEGSPVHSDVTLVISPGVFEVTRQQPLGYGTSLLPALKQMSRVAL
jgi:hypothetical protein